jgi:hypothetical protein
MGLAKKFAKEASGAKKMLSLVGSDRALKPTLEPIAVSRRSVTSTFVEADVGFCETMES